MTANFSTSTKTDRIVSSINTMNSMQEFFDFRTIRWECGIPAVIMRGTEEDWKGLLLKIESLEKLLQPIKDKLFLNSWWKNTKSIIKKLLETYQGTPDLPWWHSIIVKTDYYDSWGSGDGIGWCKAYNGWFLTDILGLSNTIYLSKIKTPLVTVKMQIKKPLNPAEEADDEQDLTSDDEQEEAAFIAGKVGYKIEKDEDKNWPRIIPVHSWALCLEPNSVYLQGLKDWEDKMIGA